MKSAVAHVAHRSTHTHRDVNGGWLRPAVFGAMDGLLTNMGLMAGVAGGAMPHTGIIITGLAGVVAGACAMAAGEYASVASQKEMMLAELAVERKELQENPAEEAEELAALYVARGVEPEVAREFARQLSRDPEKALELHIREELGVDPADLPSPVVAAVSSFLSFGLGAAVPLLPYLLGATAIWPAVLCTLIGLFVCGSVTALVTRTPWWSGGLRQLGLGLASSAVTYGLGALLGTAV